MANKTPYFGFNYFGPGVPGAITDDGSKFTLSDRLVLDRILKAFEEHDHSGGQLMADPSGPPALALDSQSGQLPGGLNIYYRISYVDQFGLESSASFEGVQVTPTPASAPGQPILSSAPLDPASTAPGLGEGTYSYAVTAFIGVTETPIGIDASLTLDGTEATVVVTMPDPQDTQTQWGIWRQGPNDVGWTRIGALDVADLDFVDDGETPPNPCADDPNQAPPTQNLTASTNLVTITVPDPALVAANPSLIKSWRIYRTFTSGVYGASSLLAEVTTTDPVAGGLITTFEDDGSLTLQLGQPYESSQALLPSKSIGGGGSGGAGAVQIRSTDATAMWAVSCTTDGALVTDPSMIPLTPGDVYLVSDDAVTWKLTADADGSLRTTVGSPVAGDTVLRGGAMVATHDGTLAYQLTVSTAGALVTTAAGVGHDQRYVFPTGTVLPDPTGKAEGSPFVIDNGDGTASLRVLISGAWVPTT